MGAQPAVSGCSGLVRSLLKLPAARQIDLVGHDTPDSWLIVAPGLTAGSLLQVLPFQPSASASRWPFVPKTLPVATQSDVVRQLIPVSVPLWDAASTCQPLPVSSAARICGPPAESQNPTATQWPTVGQETASSSLTLALGFGVAIARQLVPFHDSASVW